MKKYFSAENRCLCQLFSYLDLQQYLYKSHGNMLINFMRILNKWTDNTLRFWGEIVIIYFSRLQTKIFIKVGHVVGYLLFDRNTIWTGKILHTILPVSSCYSYRHKYSRNSLFLSQSFAKTPQEDSYFHWLFHELINRN